MPVKIDDTSADEYKRFSKVESVSFDGSFTAVPIVYDNQNYGVLCFESLKEKCLFKCRCSVFEERSKYFFICYLFIF